jgi:hypothetical protein
MKHVGVEILERINKNPLLPWAFVGLFANGIARCSVQPSRCFYLSFHLQVSQFCHHFPSACKTLINGGVQFQKPFANNMNFSTRNKSSLQNRLPPSDEDLNGPQRVTCFRQCSFQWRLFDGESARFRYDPRNWRPWDVSLYSKTVCGNVYKYRPG